MKVEKISADNIEPLTHLFLELWPECHFDEEYEICENILKSNNETCFLIKDGSDFVAFIQLSLRTDYVEGATTSPVVYIEGLYVKPEYRKSGIAKKLVELGENWGKEKGCTQYASDTEITNRQSIAFHKKVGFSEANRLVCFIKDI